MNFLENSEWTALEKRIEKLKCKIIKPKIKIRSSSKKLQTVKNVSKKITPKIQHRPNHKRNRSSIEASRIELFISSEDYLSEFLGIIKKHFVRDDSLSKDIKSLNKKFIVSYSNFYHY